MKRFWKNFRVIIEKGDTCFNKCAFRSPARSGLSASGGGPGVPVGCLWCLFDVFFGVGLGAAILEVLGALGGPKVAPNL